MISLHFGNTAILTDGMQPGTSYNQVSNTLSGSDNLPFNAIRASPIQIYYGISEFSFKTSSKDILWVSKAKQWLNSLTR